MSLALGNGAPTRRATDCNASRLQFDVTPSVARGLPEPETSGRGAPATQRLGEPTAPGVIASSGYGYTREDGVSVIPIGALGPQSVGWWRDPLLSATMASKWRTRERACIQLGQKMGMRSEATTIRSRFSGPPTLMKSVKRYPPGE